RSAAAGIARHGAPDPGDRRRDGAQARAWRSHRRPAAAGELDAPHLRSSVDATNGPAVNRFWTPIVHGLSPYVPGEQPKLDGLIKLNTNENPYGPSPRALAAIASATDRLRLYPDPNASLLRETIAARLGVAPKEVFVGNGSDEVLAHTFQGLLKHDAPLLFP